MRLCIYLHLKNPFLTLRRHTAPRAPHREHLILFFIDVSRMSDAKRIFYSFITVFIAVSQPRSGCRDALQSIISGLFPCHGVPLFLPLGISKEMTDHFSSA